METKTPKACLSVALCTCKIVTLKVEELRSARKNLRPFFQEISYGSTKKRQKIKTHLPNRNYQILSQTIDIAKLKSIKQFKTNLLDKNPNLLPKHVLCFAALFLNKPP
jgi:hypothetical protein